MQQSRNVINHSLGIVSKHAFKSASTIQLTLRRSIPKTRASSASCAPRARPEPVTEIVAFGGRRVRTAPAGTWRELPVCSLGRGRKRTRASEGVPSGQFSGRNGSKDVTRAGTPRRALQSVRDRGPNGRRRFRRRARPHPLPRRRRPRALVWTPRPNDDRQRRRSGGAMRSDTSCRAAKPVQARNSPSLNTMRPKIQDQSIWEGYLQPADCIRISFFAVSTHTRECVLAHSQNVTLAAMQTALRNACAPRSLRVAIRPRPMSRRNIRSIRLRC